jgi:hypothetical protein
MAITTSGFSIIESTEAEPSSIKTSTAAIIPTSAEAAIIENAAAGIIAITVQILGWPLFSIGPSLLTDLF